MEHRISIITITYNSAKTIEETILSVINQNYSNLEYIIIDGKSTDDTLNIINKYKTKINKIISEPDKGISDAFNKGIREATGEIIGIINSDDMLNTDVLNKINDIVNAYPNNDIYYGNGIIFDKESNYIYKPIYKIENILKYMFICHPSTFERKTAYEKYGDFNINYKCSMDFELLSRMYIKGAKFKYFDYECALFRRGGTSWKTFDVTMEESTQIAIRNGIEPKEAKKYYKKIKIKQRIIQLTKKLNLEIILRNLVKKQYKFNGKRW